MARVLVVDDEESICWGLDKLCQSMGHSTTICSSAEDGLNAAEAQNHDLIVLDVRLVRRRPRVVLELEVVDAIVDATEPIGREQFRVRLVLGNLGVENHRRPLFRGVKVEYQARGHAPGGQVLEQDGDQRRVL